MSNDALMKPVSLELYESDPPLMGNDLNTDDPGLFE